MFKKRQRSLLAELNLQSTLPKEIFEASRIAGTEQFMAIGAFGKESSYTMFNLNVSFEPVSCEGPKGEKGRSRTEMYASPL